MNALEVVARGVARPFVPRPARRGMGLDDVLALLSLDNAIVIPTTLRVDREEIEQSFVGFMTGLYQRNAIVFAAIMTRYLLFSQVRFQFQQMRGGQPANLFGTPELARLDVPEPGRSTADLLARWMLDNDVAGIGYIVSTGGVLKRLRPDWTAAVFSSPREDFLPVDPDATLEGFAYIPGGPGSGGKVMSYLPEQVAWFSTVPDGVRNLVGMSWLTPILREVQADNAATNHKLAYYRNAATPNLAVTMPSGMKREEAEQWIELMEQEHSGVSNAWRSLYFAGGATAQIVGAQLGQLDFRNIQAAGETRIASASGIHPSLLGITDGLQGSSLNAGNFAAAARWTADRFLYAAWSNAAGSLQRLINLPNRGSRLWYDTRQVPFLRDDIEARAKVVQAEADVIGGLINNGFEPGSVVSAVLADGDWAQLSHTGLVSVQLQTPGAGQIVGSRTIDHRLPPVEIPGAVVPMRAIETFWPVTGRSVAVGEILGGTVVSSDHPIVREFPAMFEPDTVAAGRPTTQIVTREQVLAKRAELRAGGQPHGIDSLAVALRVSPATIRRRLDEGS